ncbi:MAG: hypothetical protein JXQ73_02350 [Phycisphaerae bacterium]|nr:hypothetical protein [Phycisphaerae bacterium]
MLRNLDSFLWDDEFPVPRERRLRCEGCGCDLTGQRQRTCPECRRPFYPAIPAALRIQRRRCGYQLTGLILYGGHWRGHLGPRQFFAVGVVWALVGMLIALTW